MIEEVSRCVKCKKAVVGENRFTHYDHVLHKKCLKLLQKKFAEAREVPCPSCKNMIAIPDDLGLEESEVKNSQHEGDGPIPVENPRVDPRIDFLLQISPKCCQRLPRKVLLGGAGVILVLCLSANVTLITLTGLMFADKISDVPSHGVVPPLFLVASIGNTFLSTLCLMAFIPHCKKERNVVEI